MIVQWVGKGIWHVAFVGATLLFGCNKPVDCSPPPGYAALLELQADAKAAEAAGDLERANIILKRALTAADSIPSDFEGDRTVIELDDSGQHLLMADIGEQRGELRMAVGVRASTLSGKLHSRSGRLRPGCRK